ncbi:Ser-Thr-rich GPI-anchored membrane family protein, partial [Thermodesulfobacteriota bacterium]
MKKTVALTLLFVLGLFMGVSSAVEVIVLAPQQYVRTTGQPNEYTDTFAAIDGEGTLIVKNGDENGDHRVSSARVLINGKEVFGASNFNQQVYHLEASVNLFKENTVSIELNSKPGSYLTITITIDVPLPAVLIAANPNTVTTGGSATLTWSSTDADTCVIEPGIDPVDVNGSVTVTPTQTTIYTATVTNLGGIGTATAKVTVIYPPSITMVEPDGIDDNADTSYTIKWTDADPDSNATISLYYDTDNSGTDGTLIVNGLNEDPDIAGDEYFWNTADIADGAYYVYAIIDDDVHNPVIAYSPGMVTVSHNTPPSITITAVNMYVGANTYEAIDSNTTDGPTFDWFDISSVGTYVSLSDDAYRNVSLPFNFPFYNEIKNSVKISSNGYLTFGSDGTDYSNDPIPSWIYPNDYIAPFWDDLNPRRGGAIYYYHDVIVDRFIVQYTDILPYSGSGTKTFQTILYPNGNILFQYKDMAGYLTSATVGIENKGASDGLQIVYNAPYIENNLAILLKRAINRVVIKWEDTDPDNDAAISLYYDTGAEGADGVIIAEGLNEDPDGESDKYLWDLSEIADGSYYIYAIIDDGVNAPVIDYADAAVTIDQNTPHFNPIPDKVVIEGEPLSFSVTAYDPNGDPLTFSASNLPQGSAFNASTQTFSWTP